MKALHGEPDFQLVATIAFPDVSTAESWYQSPAYQALIQNRDEALDSTIVLIA